MNIHRQVRVIASAVSTKRNNKKNPRTSRGFFIGELYTYSVTNCLLA